MGGAAGVIEKLHGQTIEESATTRQTIQTLQTIQHNTRLDNTNNTKTIHGLVVWLIGDTLIGIIMIRLTFFFPGSLFP